MQEDKNLKELLSTGALEQAPPAFTGSVMKRIERIRYINEPLVSKKWVRVFRITFFTVTGLLALTGLLIKLSAIPFTINIDLPETYLQYSNTIIIYLVAFWILIYLSQKLERRSKSYR